MNQRDTKMRGPRPPMGRVNRDHGSGRPGAFGYGRSGTLYEGQSYHNSYSVARGPEWSGLRSPHSSDNNNSLPHIHE